MVGALEQGNMVEGEQGQGRDTLRENQIAGNGIQGEGEGGTHGVLATKSIPCSLNARHASFHS